MDDLLGVGADDFSDDEGAAGADVGFGGHEVEAEVAVGAGGGLPDFPAVEVGVVGGFDDEPGVDGDGAEVGDGGGVDTDDGRAGDLQDFEFGEFGLVWDVRGVAVEDGRDDEDASEDEEPAGAHGE